MGTNVYMCKIPTQEDIDAIKRKLDKLEYQKVIDAIEDLRSASEVHIGKRSAGWKFLFAQNPKYYTETKKDISRFLRSPGWVLKNEYGETINPDNFWDEYVEPFKNGLDGVEYRYYDREYLTDEGLRFTTGNFS